MRTDKRTDKHNEANSRFSQLCEKRLERDGCLSQNIPTSEFLIPLMKSGRVEVLTCCRMTNNKNAFFDITVLSRAFMQVCFQFYSLIYGSL